MSEWPFVVKCWLLYLYQTDAVTRFAVSVGSCVSSDLARWTWPLQLLYCYRITTGVLQACKYTKKNVYGTTVAEMWCNWCWPGINQGMSGSNTVWALVHHPTSNTGLVVDSGIKVYLRRQKLPSESLPFFLRPLMSLFLTLAVFILHPNLVLCTVYDPPSLCSFIPQTTSADFKTILHPEFITREMPFKKKGEKRPSINCAYKE